MNTVYASTYLYPLQFLSSVSYNFVGTGLLQSLVKFIPSYFIFLCNWKWDCFLIFPSDSLLLVYKRATDFWMFISYPAILINSFITSSGFLLES